MSSEKMLSVAEVCELPPGDEQNATWINPGFEGVVLNIAQKQTKAGGNFWPCQIGDTTGSARLEMSLFTSPKFKVGDTIEVSGRGLRRTEYNGNPQAAVGKDTEIHVVARGTGGGQPPAGGNSIPQHSQAAKQDAALNGSVAIVNGQSVGCALNNAWEAMRHCYPGTELLKQLPTPEFWAALKQIASDHLRIAAALEHGKVSPATWKLAAQQREEDEQQKQEREPEPPPRQQQQRAPARRTSPQDEREAANLSNTPDEDVPF